MSMVIRLIVLAILAFGLYRFISSRRSHTED
jgi:hypothetical protein